MAMTAQATGMGEAEMYAANVLGDCRAREMSGQKRK